MRIQVRLAAAAIILAAASVAFIAPTLAAEYTLKWAVVTRGDMQEKFGHKLAEILPKATNGRVEVITTLRTLTRQETSELDDEITRVNELLGR